MTVGPIWNTGGTETEIIVPVSVLGPERAGTEMGGDLLAYDFYVNNLSLSLNLNKKICYNYIKMNHIAFFLSYLMFPKSLALFDLLLT